MTKGIQEIGNSAQYSALKNFFSKIHPRKKLSKYYTSRVLYIPLCSPNPPIFGKNHQNAESSAPLLCRDKNIGIYIPVNTSCPERPRELIRSQVVDIVVKKSSFCFGLPMRQRILPTQTK